MMNIDENVISRLRELLDAAYDEINYLHTEISDLNREIHQLESIVDSYGE